MAAPRKLTPTQEVAVILDLHKGMTWREAAKKWGVNPGTIGAIKKRFQKDDEPAKQLHPCGTPAAYRRHQRAGELADEKCLKAWAAELRRYRREKKNEAGSSDLAR